MRVIAPSRKQKESAGKLGFRVSRQAAAILALIASLQADATAQKLLQPTALTPPAAERRAVLTAAATASLPVTLVGAPAPARRWAPQEPFVGSNSKGAENPALRREFVGAGPVARVAGSFIPVMANRFEVAHVSRVESERFEHFPALYQEDAPFSTQVRMPLADLWGGRLQLDAFYREISAHSIFHGLSLSGSIGWTRPQSLTLRAATSYGIQLSFQVPQIRPRTLYRYLLGGRG